MVIGSVFAPFSTESLLQFFQSLSPLLQVILLLFLNNETNLDEFVICGSVKRVSALFPQPPEPTSLKQGPSIYCNYSANADICFHNVNSRDPKLNFTHPQQHLKNWVHILLLDEFSPLSFHARKLLPNHSGCFLLVFLAYPLGMAQMVHSWSYLVLFLSLESRSVCNVFKFHAF